MEQEMITIPKRRYLELLEEVGILRDPEMMKALNELIKFHTGKSPR